MRLLLLLLISTLFSAAEEEGSLQISHTIKHTADDLLETSLVFSAPKKILSSEVLYKKAGNPEWQRLKSVHTETYINAVLPHGTVDYVFLITLPEEQSIRHPKSGTHTVPKDLVQEKRKALKGGSTPDDKWIYKTVNEQELFMDVFYPEGYLTSKTPFPIILIFHGGSWAVGETNWHYPDCEYWAKRGMVAVSVDYRLSKRDGVSPVPLECMKDAQAAMRYVRKHAKELKLNPHKVVAAGGSAGGQLAASLACISSPETAHSDDDLQISAIPNATVLYNPYFRCNYDPASYVKKDLPPTISFLGDKDSAIPTETLLTYHKRLIEHGNSSEYYIAHGGKHGLCNGRNTSNPFFYWSVNKIDAFLVKHGIITGPSLIEVPQGVKTLTAPLDYTEHLSSSH